MAKLTVQKSAMFERATSREQSNKTIFCRFLGKNRKCEFIFQKENKSKKISQQIWNENEIFTSIDNSQQGAECKNYLHCATFSLKMENEKPTQNVEATSALRLSVVYLPCCPYVQNACFRHNRSTITASTSTMSHKQKEKAKFVFKFPNFNAATDMCPDSKLNKTQISNKFFSTKLSRNC